MIALTHEQIKNDAQAARLQLEASLEDGVPRLVRLLCGSGNLALTFTWGHSGPPRPYRYGNGSIQAT
jgi:hypothetical protein